MTTDLRYALGQLKRLCGAKQSVEAMMMRDGVERAIDALERCIEEAADAEARLDRLEARGVDTGV